ncbi:MAG: glycosyltransferase family 4 protein [Chroococcidiopsidaceae cyanobacterium CP_BM_RX_35]|nr:glycosyltransferase family 4 protein [Chroococcidiopsidaceae cyanobacterium CP_BM_RX_35]
MGTSDMRVLIVAENASARFGGEAFLPIHYFQLLRSRNIETWLLTHARTQTELETLFAEDRDRLYFMSDTWVHRLSWRLGQPLPRRLGELTTGMVSHIHTENIQRRIVRQLVREHKINIVHQPMPVSPKSPSLLFDVGAPVIIRPLNGGMEFPPAFRSRQSRLEEVAIALVRHPQVSHFWNRILPGKLKAQTLLVANERTKQALPSGVGGEVIKLAKNGVDLSVLQATAPLSKESNQTVRFVYLGRLIGWKAVDLLLESFKPVADQTDAVLEIIGDGPMRAELEEQASQLDLGQNVVFTGWLSQEQCVLRLQHADALVLPSLWECGGAVVLEAMALGLPVIATDWGGPADYVDSANGILIRPTSKPEFMNGLTDAMLKLVQSPDLRQKMGSAGQERVRQQFDWERKVDRMIEIYQQTDAAWQT